MTSEPICHIGVVKQNIAGDGHFVLGQVFMENFYVGFDASDDERNRIGLSYHLSGETYESETVQPEDVPKVDDELDSLITMIVLLCIVIAVILAAVFFCYCMKRRQKERLAKAKAYFNSLETNDDENRLDKEDELEA